MKRILVVLAVLAGFGATAEAGPNGADVKAALVRCAEVTYPTPLAGCGDDPLTAGRAEIHKNGDVAATLTGALANASYDLVLHGANVSAPLPIAVATTGTLGNRAVHRRSGVDMSQ